MNEHNGTWTPDKVRELLRGFGGSIRGKKGGKILPTEHLIRYIEEAWSPRSNEIEQEQEGGEPHELTQQGQTRRT